MTDDVGDRICTKLDRCTWLLLINLVLSAMTLGVLLCHAYG